jgi:hypothetical protein
MAKLRERLQDGTKRQAVIDDALLVLDQEVADKSGLTGIAIKTAYAMVKGIKPGFIREVVDHLLDDFVDALEPIATEAADKGARAGDYLESNRGRVADALLSITDRKAQNAKNRAPIERRPSLRNGSAGRQSLAHNLHNPNRVS